MRFSTVAAALLPVGAAYAATHVVQVGGSGNLVYTPNQLKANPGDIIRFEFHQKNHTATQSAFTKPCTPLKGGFNSGL